MVQSIYKYFDSDLSESQRTKLYTSKLLYQGSRTTTCIQCTSTFRMHSYAQSVYSQCLKETQIPYTSYDKFT